MPARGAAEAGGLDHAARELTDRSLEQVPETELDVPARVVLARDAAERRVRWVGVGAVPVRVIREVADLRAELDAVIRVQAHVLEQRDVPLILPRIVDPESRRVAEGAGRGFLERRRIEP